MGILKAVFSRNNKEQRESASRTTARDVPVSGPSVRPLPAVQHHGSNQVLVNQPPMRSPYITAPHPLIGIKEWYLCADATVDICFVHGLGGHCDTSWTTPPQIEPWPKAWLGPQLKTARLLTYGYDAHAIRMNVASSNRLLDHATGLLNDLSSDRERKHASNRPLIFVAHSVGGLIVKKALLLSHKVSEEHKTSEQPFKQIFACTKGIAFLGTPHSDAFMTEWAKIPAAVLGLVNSTNASLLQVLQGENQFLKAIQVEFLHLARGFNHQRLDIISFSEQHPYPVVGIVVSKDSATLPGYTNFSIPGNHQGMIMFSSVQDQGFQRLYQQLWVWESEIRSGHSINPAQKSSNVASSFSTLTLSNPNVICSQDVVSAMSVEEQLQKQKLSSIFCRWCERCKSGIRYYSDSFFCMECKYWLCRSCRNVHTTLHPRRVRIQLRQWMKSSIDFTPSSDCNVCSKHALARLQCGSKDCGYSLCMWCFQNGSKRDKSLEEHIGQNATHLVFFALYPENWRVTQEWEVSPCTCFDRAASVTHCERCHKPTDIDSNVYWCHPCRLTWGFTQWICESCFLEPKEEHARHKQEHFFTKAVVEYRPNLPEDQKERFYCPKCQQWLGELDYAAHRHDNTEAASEHSDSLSLQRSPDLHWVINPRSKDAYRLSLYRTCDKELVAKRSAQYADSLPANTVLSRCAQCQFVPAYKKSATVCIKGNCAYSVYCASCTEAGRIDHRHKSSMYVVTIQRKRDLPVAKLACQKCLKNFLKSDFMGIFCGECKQFAVCWTCMRANAKGGAFALEESFMSHMITTTNNCPALDWKLIYENLASPHLAQIKRMVAALS